MSHFLRDWKQLTAAQKTAFLVVVSQFVSDLRNGKRTRSSLRVKKMQGIDNVWEISWAPDGRATFHYGDPVSEGMPHIVWRRIGTHS